MSNTPSPAPKLKPITDTKIPGTDIPDVSGANAESERQKAWMSRVAVSTAVMAAGAAISSMFAGSHLNQAMFEQIREADQWSFYQSKGIKHAVLEGRIATLVALGKDPSNDDKLTLARYEKEQSEIKSEAQKHKGLTEDHLARYKMLSRAATAMQIGIALAAVALLLRRNVFWAIALTAGAIGAAFLVLGLL